MDWNGERTTPATTGPENLIETYRRDARRARLLTKEEERRLARAIRRGGADAESARRTLAESNLRLVLHVVRSFEGRGMPLLDLVQEGNIGLMRAVERFNPRKGCRFSTYAIWWIRQAVQRALATSSRLVRVPSGSLDLTSKARRVAEDIRQESQREPDVSEIAEVMKRDPDRLTAAMRGAAGIHPVSLDGSARSGEDPQRGSVGATLTAPAERQVPLDPLELRKILSVLRPRHRHVIVRRFGLDGQPEETLESVARRLDMSRERVRQLQAEALRFLRVHRQKLVHEANGTEPVMGRARRAMRRL